MLYTNQQFVEDYSSIIKLLRKNKKCDGDTVFSEVRKIPTLGIIISPTIADIGYASYQHNNSGSIHFSNNLIHDILELVAVGRTDVRYPALFRKTAGAIYHEYQHYMDLQKIVSSSKTRSSFYKAIATVSPTEDFDGSKLEKTCDYFFSGLEFNAYSVTIATMVSSLIHQNKRKNKTMQVLIDDAISELDVAGIPLVDILATRPTMVNIFKQKVYAFLHSKLIELSDNQKLILIKSWFVKSNMAKEIKKEIADELISKIKHIKLGQDNSQILSSRIRVLIIKSNDAWLEQNLLG